MAISKVYKYFGWIHTNGTALPSVIGGVVTGGMAIVKPKLLKKQYEHYKNYKSSMANQDQLKSGWFTFIGCRVIYGVTVEEYYSYEFELRNHRGRKEFITDINRFDFYERFNNSHRKELFDDKYKTFLKYKKYYKRDVLYLVCAHAL